MQEMYRRSSSLDFSVASPLLLHIVSEILLGSLSVQQHLVSSGKSACTHLRGLFAVGDVDCCHYDDNVSLGATLHMPYTYCRMEAFVFCKKAARSSKMPCAVACL